MIAATKARVSPGRLLINGEWVEGSKKFDSINPATGEVLTQIVEASPDDVDRAVKAADHATVRRAGHRSRGSSLPVEHRDRWARGWQSNRPSSRNRQDCLHRSDRRRQTNHAFCSGHTETRHA